MNKMLMLPALLVMTITGTSAAAHAAEELVKPCMDCHGEGGASSDPNTPIIGGVPEFVLIDNMFAFKEKARPCRDAEFIHGDTSREPANKCEMFADHSEAQIESMAAWFDAQPYVPANQETDPALVAVGKQIHDIKCEKCHTEGGSIKEDEAGMLAGQWMPYLKQTLMDYAAGKREMPEKMVPKMEGLGEAEFDALVHYYGSLGKP